MRFRFLPFLLLLILGLPGESFGAPSISIVPSPLSFGEVRLTDTKDGEIQIESLESSVFVVENIYLIGGNARENEFVILSPSLRTFAMEPTEKRKIILRFSPDFEGLRAKNLVIQTSLGDTIVQLDGSGLLTQPNLVISATELTFGQVGVTGKRELLFDVTNIGEDDAKISDINVANHTGVEHFTVAVNDAGKNFPVILKQGEKVQFKVTFQGAYPLGMKTGALTLVGAVAGQTVLAVSGEVVAADIIITPSPIDFGDVEVGTPKRIPVTISLVGSVPASIDYLSDLFSPFKLIGAPALPYLLQPGEPLEVEIEIVATESGAVASQLQLVSPDVQGSNLRFAEILANVKAALKVTESQDFEFLCGAKGPITRTATLLNATSTPLTIESLANSQGVTVTSDLPLAVAPNSSQTFEYSFDPAAGDQTLIFEFRDASGSVIGRDTVNAISIEPTVPLAQTVASDRVRVASEFDISPYQLTQLDVALRVSNQDVFAIDEDSIELNEALLPNASHSLIDNGGGSYTLRITSSTPIAFDPAIPLDQQSLFSYKPRAFTAAQITSAIEANVIFEDACVTTPTSSVTLAAGDFCGSDYIRAALSGEEIRNVIVKPNPISSAIAQIEFESRMEGGLEYRILNMTGSEAASGVLPVAKTINRVSIPVAALVEGSYILELRTASSAIQTKLVIAR